METPLQQDGPVGFGGLTSLVTRLSEIPRTAAHDCASQRAPERDEPQPVAPTSRPPTPDAEDGQRADRGRNGAWIPVVVFAGLIVGAVYFNEQKLRDTEAPTQYQQSIPAHPASEDLTSIPSAPAYAPPSPPEIVEMKPDKPNGFVEPVLYRNQIYYCLVEKARIEILKDRTDDTSDQQINYFNDRVRDFNTHCSNYKFYQREMDAAKHQFDAKIAAISDQFIAGLAPTSKPAARSLQPPSGAPPTIPSSPVSSEPSYIRNAPSDQIAEVMPPYGQGHRHSREHLYYCFAESERLAWAQKSIDEASQNQLDALRMKTDDFNARCTHFSSNAADRISVRKQLASNRAAWKAQGIAMAKSWR